MSLKGIIQSCDKMLITTDNWFYAPDGKQYNAVWGEVHLLDDSVLGIKTNVRSSNWYAQVGTDENYVLIAGCQIHYAVRCEEKPNTGSVEEYRYHEGAFKKTKRSTQIYIAE